MRRPSTRVLFSLGVPLLALVLLIAAWAVDTTTARGKVPRNITLAGRDIGKLPEKQLAMAVADLAQHYVQSEIKINTPDHTFKVAAGELGLRLDQPATIAAALSMNHDTPWFRRPIQWFSSFLDQRQAPLKFTLDDKTMKAGLASLGGDAAATEPSLISGSNAITMISGSVGSQIDPSGVRDQILQRARSGEQPIVVTTKVDITQPTVTDAAAKALAERLSASTAPGLAITAGSHQATISAATVRGWIGSKVTDGQIQVTVDRTKSVDAVKAAIVSTAEPVDAKITLVEGGPTVIPSQNGESCCAPDTGDRLLATIVAGAPSVELAMNVKKPTFTTEQAVALQVKEPVGATTEWKGQAQVKSFTTYMPCCAPRNTNIRRIADMVRGTLVKPGETFSVNATVGRRTREKGYVAAGAIANGVHVDEIGGGVSQFATTMFNAAFFAGLPFGEYQAHSEHFDRYPFGREATMGFEHPDLQWKNDTPYGILIWTSSTDTSITVQFWSTQYAWGEQTGQSTSRSGSCTNVTTQRTIHYPDGRTATDNVRARYRDRGATKC